MTAPKRPRAPILRFLGGAGSVSGSRFLLDTAKARVLVDCGMFQGLKDLRLRNWERFPVDPASIDAVVLTHAHLDHSGYVPALWKQGFGGSIYATRGTRALCETILIDSAYIQERDAQQANKYGYSKHEPALPLYDHEDALGALDCFEVVPFHETRSVAEGVDVRFWHAGHILGAALVSVTLANDDGPPTRITFSGDLGRPEHPLLVSPEPPPACDALVMESTYGNRSHLDEDWDERFAETVSNTLEAGGIVLIPAFAVDRTELVLRRLAALERDGRIPSVPVHVDSPMALAALTTYRRAIREGWEEIRPELRGHDEPFATSQLIEVKDVESSKLLTASTRPAIVIAASGMATGGRVLHHLAARLPDSRNSVILVGYQAAGTRGRHLLEGATAIKMFGRYIPVRAKVSDMTGLSVHADREELLAWAGRLPERPSTVYVVHGEPEAATALCEGLRSEHDLNAVVPKLGERVRLD